MDITDKELDSVRFRILAEGRKLAAAEGLDVPTQRIADAAEVAVEVVDQLFPSRALLNAAIIGEAFDAMGDRLRSARLPQGEADVGPWIDYLVSTVFHDSSEIFGEMFWDLRHTAGVTGGLMSDLVIDRRFVRDKWTKTFSDAAWRASGRNDAPPPILARAFDAHVNLFALHSQLSLGRSLDDAAALGAELLKLVLIALVE